jgi:hypothetical protein
MQLVFPLDQQALERVRFLYLFQNPQPRYAIKSKPIYQPVKNFLHKYSNGYPFRLIKLLHVAGTKMLGYPCKQPFAKRSLFASGGLYLALDTGHPDLAVRQHFGDFTSGFSHQFGVALSIMAMSDAFRIPWGKLTPIPVHRRKVLDYTAKIPNTNCWLHLEAKGVTSDSSRANARRSIYNKKDEAHKQATNYQVAMIGTIIQAAQRGRGAIAKGLIEIIDPDDQSDPVVFLDNYQRAALYWHFVGVAIFAGLYQVAEEFIRRADSLITRQSVSLSMSTIPFKEISILESHGHRIIGVQWQPGESNNFTGNMWFYQGVDIDIILTILASDIFPNTYPYSDLEFLFTHDDSVESILPDGSYFGIGTRPNTSLLTVSPTETDIWNLSF